MKSGAKDILGLTIKGVIVKHGAGGSPRSQLFLIFADDSTYEFFTDGTGNIYTTSGLFNGGAEAAREYLKYDLETVFDEQSKVMLGFLKCSVCGKAMGRIQVVNGKTPIANCCECSG